MYNYEKIKYIEKKKEFILKRVRNKNVWYRPVVEMLKKYFCNKIRILLSRFEIRDQNVINVFLSYMYIQKYKATSECIRFVFVFQKMKGLFLFVSYGHIIYIPESPYQEFITRMVCFLFRFALVCFSISLLQFFSCQSFLVPAQFEQSFNSVLLEFGSFVLKLLLSIDLELDKLRAYAVIKKFEDRICEIKCLFK